MDQMNTSDVKGIAYSEKAYGELSPDPVVPSAF